MGSAPRDASFHVALLAPIRDAQGVVIDARVDFADDVWRAILAGGVDPTGQSLRRYLGSDPAPFHAIARVADEHEPVRAEFRHPQATDRVAEVQLTPMADRVLTMGRDVTEERALQAALERSRAELLAAQQLAQMGSWLWDPRTDRAEWSDTMLAIYGLPPGSPAPSFADQRRFYDDETISRTQALMERVVQTGEPYSMEYDLTRDDGQRRHVIAHGESVRVDGQFAGLRGTVVDITELYATRQALARSEQRFAAVLDVAVESVIVARPECDAAGEITAMRIEWTNPAWRALWGFTDDVVGRDLYTLLPPLCAYRGLHHEVLRGGPARDLTLQRPDGSIVEATIAATGDRLFLVGRDVTALRRAQQREEETRRAAQLVTLAGGIAHQFNNALMVIVGHAEQLQESAGTEAQESLATILGATERAAALTRQLLAYAQRQVLRPSSFAIDPFVQRTAKVLAATAGDAIPIRLVLGAPGESVEFDPQQLEQVLVELVRNARAAMREGGTLTLSTTVRAPFVLLSVADTGVGISADHLSRVFDPFFTGGRFGESPGLGLASVRGTMQQSGGHVSVESEQGRGAVFTLHLRQATAPAAANLKETREPPASVLVVDDDELVRQSVARSLRGLGCSVFEAATGAAALTLLGRVEIDLLLANVTLPDMTGKTIVELAVATRPHMTVAFMSGYAAAVLEAEGTLPRGAIFLAKPFGRASLHELLARTERAREASRPRPERS